MSIATAELPFTHEDRVEACAMLRDGCSTEYVCAWIGCTPEELATECPEHFEPAGTYADSTAEGLTAKARRALVAGPMTAREIATELGHQRAGEVSSILSVMMRHELVHVVGIAAGKRRFALTEKGRALITGAGPATGASCGDGSISEFQEHSQSLPPPRPSSNRTEQEHIQ